MFSIEMGYLWRMVIFIIKCGR